MTRSSRQPIFQFSLAKLSLAVIAAALLTISLFFMENKKRLSQSVFPPPISVTFIFAHSPKPVVKTVTLPQYISLESALTNYFPEIVLSPANKYTVNQQPLNITPDRFSLKSSDVIEVK